MAEQLDTTPSRHLRPPTTSNMGGIQGRICAVMGSCTYSLFKLWLMAGWRTRTDRHVTQPSSFSNSEISTCTGLYPIADNRSTDSGADVDIAANPYPIHHQFKVLAYQALKD